MNTEQIRKRKLELQQPKPLSGLRELEHIIEPKPNYVGPGPWLKAVQIKENKNGGQHADS
ncbi:MAG: hypothetical protein ACOC2P_00030 [Spirochaetota bacterium]